MSTHDLLNKRPRNVIVEGVFTTPLPETIADPVYVLVLGLDDTEAPEGPCPWIPRGATLPEEGNACVVMYTDARTPWVAWWPDMEVPSA